MSNRAGQSKRLSIAEATELILGRARPSRLSTPAPRPVVSGQRSNPKTPLGIDAPTRERMQSLAAEWTERNNAVPDSIHDEYSSMIYRGRDGRIGITDPTKGAGGKVQPGLVPPGAVALGSIHNHPYIAGLDRAWATKGYTTELVKKYMDEDMVRPSAEDWRHADHYGPGYTLFVVGPDGRLRPYSK